LISFNYFAGSGAKPIREGLFTTTQIFKAIPLLAIWLFIEVGLVEEFFFRGLLQNRLGVILRSKAGAICISALIFGLVHAPGMYLRQAGVHDGLGAEPSLLNSIVYCIAIQSVPGLFLGVLWERTRNLWLLMAIHAMFDLMPGLAEFITTWGIK
jgi:membrane protease YdiL (CAAX protease family)